MRHLGNKVRLLPKCLRFPHPMSSPQRQPFAVRGIRLTALCCAENGSSPDVSATPEVEHYDGATEESRERRMGAAESSVSSPSSERIAIRSGLSDSDGRATNEIPTTGDSSVATPSTLSAENSAPTRFSPEHHLIRCPF